MDRDTIIFYAVLGTVSSLLFDLSAGGKKKGKRRRIKNSTKTQPKNKACSIEQYIKCLN